MLVLALLCGSEAYTGELTSNDLAEDAILNESECKYQSPNTTGEYS